MLLYQFCTCIKLQYSLRLLPKCWKKIKAIIIKSYFRFPFINHNKYTLEIFFPHCLNSSTVILYREVEGNTADYDHQQNFSFPSWLLQCGTDWSILCSL